MARIHLLIGPVGAGKSTVALALCREHHALRLTLDEWMTILFRPDRPADNVMEWYVERAQRCIEQIWRVTTTALAAGSDVVLEIGLIRRDDREAFYRRVDAASADLAVYLVDAPREVRRERVARRNLEQGQTYSMEVPMPFFEIASDMWQPPDTAECRRRNIRELADSEVPSGRG